MSKPLELSGSPTELESEEIITVAAPDSPVLSISGTTANFEDDCDEITFTAGDRGQTVGIPRCQLEGAGAIHSSL